MSASITSRSAHRRPCGSAGFTLVEVILAVGVFSIVLVAINTVFFAALRLRDRTTQNLENSLPLNRALGILRRDLQNAVAPGGLMAGDFRSGVAGMGSGTLGTPATGAGTARTSAGGAAVASSMAQLGGLNFYTTTGFLSDDSPFGEIQEVNYQLSEPNDRSRPGKDLVRLVNRNILSVATPLPEQERLLSDVEYLEFGFFDGLDWRDTWDTSAGDAGLPAAVRVRLQMATRESSNLRREPIELVFLITSHSSTNQSQSITNQTQTAGGSI